MKIKFVCIADTHNMHDEIDIPDGDVLLVAGDFTMKGRPREIRKFNLFLESLPHEYKVLIAGNHDFLFEREPQKAQALLTNCIYLEDSSINISKIKIYGTPWQPWFMDWAFNLPRGNIIKEKWDMIPKDTDILITHGPPYSICDKTIHGNPEGCVDLLNAVRRLKPKYHIFGHIHEAYGINKEGKTTYINASSVNVQYKPQYPPITFEL